MEQKSFDQSVKSIKKAKHNYGQLRDLFEKLAAQAMRLNEDEDSPLHGEVMVRHAGVEVELGILDRRVRLTYRFSRKANVGLIYVHDHSVKTDDPQLIAVTKFDEEGNTDQDGGAGGNKIPLAFAVDPQSEADRKKKGDIVEAMVRRNNDNPGHWNP